MGFNSNVSDSLQEKDKLALAISCMRNGRNAQAFSLLSSQEFEKVPAAQFALGLCYLRASDPSKAIACFEQTLRALKMSNNPTRELPVSNEIYIRLAAKQIKDMSYLEPMDADFCTNFPQPAEQNTLLAMIHAYRESGMTEQARRLAAGLTGTEFAEYRKTL